MSDIIKDIGKFQSRQIDTAKRKHERELKFIEGNNAAARDEIKKSNEGQLVDLQNQHHAQVSAAVAKKEKLLEELRTQLSKSQQMTAQELSKLKNDSKQESAQIHAKLSDEREKIIGEHELYLEELNDRYNGAARSTNLDGKKRVDQMDQQMKEQYRDIEAQNKNKLSEQTENFKTRFSVDGQNYEKQKNDQDLQFKKERLTTNQRQQIELQKLTDTHSKHTKLKDTDYRKGLKDQDLFFEKRYEKQFVANNAQWKVLEAKNKKAIDDLKMGLTKEMSMASARHDDPFYQFEALKPRLKQTEDGVEISVDVPDHSKQDIQLTTNDKEAILTFNRRYNDASKTPEGVINKINKIETFTTRLTTPIILDPKSVKSSYENGTMVYTIKKA